jgi:hypothetical protein
LKWRKKMKPISKMITASAATLFAFGFLAMTTPTVHADEYCLTGPQAAHGCGYPNMEACQAASAGIGGTCGEHVQTPNNALAYAPKQTRSRSEFRPKKPAGQ